MANAEVKVSKLVTFMCNDKEIKVRVFKKMNKIELDDLKNTIAGIAGGTDFEIRNKKGNQNLGLTTLYLAKDEDQPLTVISKASASDYVFLNVGGKMFETTKATLVRSPYFDKLLKNPSQLNGYYFLDRNPALFDFVLDFLRTEMFSMELGNIKATSLFEEFKFFEIDISNLNLPEIQHNVAKLLMLKREKRRRSSKSTFSSSSLSSSYSIPLKNEANGDLPEIDEMIDELKLTEKEQQTADS